MSSNNWFIANKNEYRIIDGVDISNKINVRWVVECLICGAIFIDKDIIQSRLMYLRHCIQAHKQNYLQHYGV